MKIELTDKASGKKFVVADQDIKLLEPLDAGGSHVVLAPDMGREVVEDYAALKAVIGAMDVPAAQAVVAQLAKKKK